MAGYYDPATGDIEKEKPKSANPQQWESMPGVRSIQSSPWSFPNPNTANFNPPAPPAVPAAREALNSPPPTAPAAPTRKRATGDINTGPTSHEEKTYYGFRPDQEAQVIRGMESVPLDKNFRDMRSPEELAQGNMLRAEYYRDKLLAPSPLPQTYQDWGIISDKEKKLRMDAYTATQQHNLGLAAEITRDTLGLSGNLSRDASEIYKQRISDAGALAREKVQQAGATGRTNLTQAGEDRRLGLQIESGMKGAGKYDHADQKEIDTLITAYYSQDTDPAMRPQIEKRLNELRHPSAGRAKPTLEQVKAEIKRQGLQYTDKQIQDYYNAKYGR